MSFMGKAIRGSSRIAPALTKTKSAVSGVIVKHPLTSVAAGGAVGAGLNARRSSHSGIDYKY